MRPWGVSVGRENQHDLYPHPLEICASGRLSRQNDETVQRLYKPRLASPSSQNYHSSLLVADNLYLYHFLSPLKPCTLPTTLYSWFYERLSTPRLDQTTSLPVTTLVLYYLHPKSTAKLAGILSHAAMKEAQPAAAATTSAPSSAKIKSAETSADAHRA